MPKQYQLYVYDISCGSCAEIITSILMPQGSITNVTDIDINIDTKLVKVIVNDNSDYDAAKIQAEILTVFSNVEIDDKEKANEEDEEKRRQLSKKIIRGHIYKGILACGVGALLLTLSLCGIGIPFFVMYLVGGVCSLLTLWIGKDSYKKAFASLRDKKVNMEVLFSISSVVALVVSILSLCPIPGLSLPMLFDTPLLIFGFHHIGTAIKQASERVIASNLNHRSLAPRKVHLINETFKATSVLVEVDKLQIGDCILVKQGQRIPVDGSYLDEDVLEVDDSLRNGGALSKLLEKNHSVFAGMKVNKDCHIKVTATVANSWLAQRDQECEANKNVKPAIEHTAETILKFFVPGILLLAVTVGAGVGIFISPVLAVLLAIAILVSACPCILGLVVPLAIKIAVGKGLKQGIEFVNHKSVQDVADAKIDVVVFDLNGTLTQGKLTIEKFKIFSSDSEEELLQAVYAIEKNSSHLMAKAICSHIKKSSTGKLDEKLSLAAKNCGQGISTEWNGHRYSIGNSTQMDKLMSDNLRKYINFLEDNARQVILIAKDNKIQGYFVVNDPLCPDALNTITQLKSQGIRPMIITGSSSRTAYAIGKQLGVPKDDIKANCVEGEGTKKSVHVVELKNQGLGVAVVGDYINDIGAFDHADLSFFKQHPCSEEEREKFSKEKDPREIAKSRAQVIIHNLSGILDAFVISKRALSQIKQCLALSLAYNVLTFGFIVSLPLVLALSFVCPPSVFAAVMILQVVVLLFKIYRYKCQEMTSVTEFSEQPSDDLEKGTLVSEENFSLENSSQEILSDLNDESLGSETSDKSDGSEFKFKLYRSKSNDWFPSTRSSDQLLPEDVNYNSYRLGL